MLIEVSDDSKPVLSHISSEYMHHQLLVISNGKVVGAPIIEGVFQSKFELVVPDQEIGKAIVRKVCALLKSFDWIPMYDATVLRISDGGVK